MNRFAEAFDSIDKLVFSRSLKAWEGHNTRMVRTGFRDEILKLKQAQGKNSLIGGVALPSQLMELGLVDEYRLEGSSLEERFQLKLVDSKVFDSGGVALRYLKQ